MKKLPAHLRPSRKTSQLASGLLGASLVAYYLRKDRKKKSERRVYYESIHSGLIEFGVNYGHDPGNAAPLREVDNLYPLDNGAPDDTRDMRNYHEGKLKDYDKLEADAEQKRTRNVPKQYDQRGKERAEYSRWEKQLKEMYKKLTAIQEDLDDRYQRWLEEHADDDNPVTDIGYGDDPDAPGGILCRTATLSTVDGTTHVSTGIYDNRCA
jgi:hypothetical protein